LSFFTPQAAGDRFALRLLEEYHADLTVAQGPVESGVRVGDVRLQQDGTSSRILSPTPLRPHERGSRRDAGGAEVTTSSSM
jgi:hypothetical protein